MFSGCVCLCDSCGTRKSRLPEIAVLKARVDVPKRQKSESKCVRETCVRDEWRQKNKKKRKREMQRRSLRYKESALD